MRFACGFKFQTSIPLSYQSCSATAWRLDFAGIYFCKGLQMTEPLKTQRESLAFNYRPTFGVCNLFAEFLVDAALPKT